jgi:EAL domain-containing protein (putative c-di-GMP-specific phosphodiesterase class I)
VATLLALWNLGLDDSPAGRQPRVLAIALLVCCVVPVTGLDALAALRRNPPSANRPVGAMLCVLGLANLALARQGVPAQVPAAAVLMIFGPMLLVYGARHWDPPARGGEAREWPLPVAVRALCHVGPAGVAVAVALDRLVEGRAFDPVGRLLGLLLLALLAARETQMWLGVRARLAELNRLLDKGDRDGAGPGRLAAGRVSRRRLVAELRARLAGAQRGGALLVVDHEATGRAAAGPENSHGMVAQLGDGRLALLVDGGPLRVGVVATRLLDAYGTRAGAPTVSVGIAELTAAATPVGLLNRARLAQERAARKGTGVEWFDAHLAAAETRRRHVLRYLPGALERDEFTVCYRPVVDLQAGQTVGSQLVLRWHSPQLGPVRPSEFLPAVEETGGIGALGEWTVGAACRQLARWRGEGRELWLLLRVVGSYLLDPDLTSGVHAALARHRVPAGQLVLETAGDAVHRYRGAAVEQLDKLRDLGARTCLVGTGTTGLALLRQLPVDMLKLTGALAGPAAPDEPPGRALVPDAGTGRSLAAGDAATTGALALVGRVARRYGVEVLVDSVPHAGDLAQVRDAGCRFAAGPVFGEPMAPERFEAMLRDFRTVGWPAPVL